MYILHTHAQQQADKVALDTGLTVYTHMHYASCILIPDTVYSILILIVCMNKYNMLCLSH